MLLECIRSYLKSVLRYKYLILDTYHQDILYIYVSKDVRIRGYFSKAKKVCEKKSLGNSGWYYKVYFGGSFIECMDFKYSEVYNSVFPYSFSPFPMFSQTR